MAWMLRLIHISIHALRKESDGSWTCNSSKSAEFQSTLSVRRATVAVAAPVNHVIISIHALRKESDHELYVRSSTCPISIHALRKESDTGNPYLLMVQFVFQSTLSVRRATFSRFLKSRILIISIHALRKESDAYNYCMHTPESYFNPRSP